jgi:hypothetical protein
MTGNGEHRFLKVFLFWVVLVNLECLLVGLVVLDSYWAELAASFVMVLGHLLLLSYPAR